MSYDFSFSKWCAQKRAYYAEKWDDSNLDKRFIPYFVSQKRIKVRIHGEERFGTVGVTTGWRPAFLLRRRRFDYGSSCLLDDPNAEILAVQRNGRYVPIHG